MACAIPQGGQATYNSITIANIIHHISDGYEDVIPTAEELLRDSASSTKEEIARAVDEEVAYLERSLEETKATVETKDGVIARLESIYGCKSYKKKPSYFFFQRFAQNLDFRIGPLWPKILYFKTERSPRARL